KGKAKAFVRTYGFLAAILPYSIAAWEKLSIFLNFLVPKLPAPTEEDFSRGILETIDMDSYRVEVRSSVSIALPDEDAEIGPVPAIQRQPRLPQVAAGRELCVHVCAPVGAQPRLRNHECARTDVRTDLSLVQARENSGPALGGLRPSVDLRRHES